MILISCSLALFNQMTLHSQISAVTPVPVLLVCMNLGVYTPFYALCLYACKHKKVTRDDKVNIFQVGRFMCS